MTFETWLREHHYSESTIKTTIRDVRFHTGDGGGTAQPLAGSAKFSVRRYVAFLRETKGATRAAIDALAERAASKPELGGHVGKRRRKRKAVAHTDEDWASLAAALSEDESIEGRVLAVIAATGLRVGDILRLPVAALRAGLKTGTIVVVQKGDSERQQPVEGAGGAWELLEAALPRGSQNVAEAVCPGNPSPLGGECAYKRVSRHLQELGRQLGLEGRIHLHRMRRTLIVQALRVSKDIHAVQEFAGHRLMRTTAAYVDEPMPQRTAELQKAIREKFTK